MMKRKRHELHEKRSWLTIDAIISHPQAAASLQDFFYGLLRSTCSGCRGGFLHQILQELLMSAMSLEEKMGRRQKRWRRVRFSASGVRTAGQCSVIWIVMRFKVRFVLQGLTCQPIPQFQPTIPGPLLQELLEMIGWRTPWFVSVPSSLSSLRLPYFLSVLNSCSVLSSLLTELLLILSAGRYECHKSWRRWAIRRWML